MECAACCNEISRNEESLKCCLSHCCKEFHILCIGEKTLSPDLRAAWVCPECRCAAKKGGDNSLTPVGTTKKIRDPYVTHRVKAQFRPAEITRNDVTSDLSSHVVQQADTLKCEITSMREQFSKDMGRYETRLEQSVQVIENYKLMLGQAMSTIASHEAKLETCTSLIETFINVVKKHEELSSATLKAITEYSDLRSTHAQSTKTMLQQCSQPMKKPANVATASKASIHPDPKKKGQTKKTGARRVLKVSEPGQNELSADSSQVAEGEDVRPSSQPGRVLTAAIRSRSTEHGSELSDENTSLTTTSQEFRKSITARNADEDEHQESWQIVGPRRSNRFRKNTNSVTVGTARDTHGLEVAKKLTYIQVWQFKADTTVEEIKEYLNRIVQAEYYVEKRQIRTTRHASFIIGMPTDIKPQVASSTAWPQGVRFANWFFRAPSLLLPTPK